MKIEYFLMYEYPQFEVRKFDFSIIDGSIAICSLLLDWFFRMSVVRIIPMCMSTFSHVFRFEIV